MKTQQPKYRYIANLWDINPLDHGGAFVFEDMAKVYNPKIILFAGFENDARGSKQTVYEIGCDKCTFINGILSDNSYHPDNATWYADKIDSICDSCNVERETLIEKLCSDDARERADGYYILTLYYGAYEFDTQPREMTRTEIRHCWPAPFKK